MELVFALKEGTTSSSLATPTVKSETSKGVFVVDVERTFLGEHKKNVSTSVSTSTPNPLFPLSCYAHDNQASLASLGVPLVLDPLQTFIFHLYDEYEGFHHDQMQRIQDFTREKTIHLVICIQS